MTQFVENLMSRASKLSKTIALAEGTDVRAAKAAEILTQKNVCKVVLIGNEEEIKTKFPEIDFTGVSFDDPKTSEHRAEYANTLYELRKAKGMTEEQALNIVTTNNMFYACVALKRGDVDGVVGGAVFSSADVSRAAFQVIKAAPGISSVSSCFVMVPPEDFKYKKYPAYIFSDCAVIPYPTSDQLSDIVVAAADSAKKICEMDPKIAMLSFSTKGSANHESVEKVRVAYQKSKKNIPKSTLTASFNSTRPSLTAWQIKKHPAAPLQARQTFSFSPTSMQATSATRSHNALATAWQSDLSCKVLLFPSTI